MRRVFFCFLFFSSICYGQNTLLKCLGKEEGELFKKRAQGSIIRLNHDLIMEFIQFPDFQPLTRSYFDDICNQNHLSPSFKLLEMTFRHKSALFKRPNSNAALYYFNQAPGIFMRFISQIRTYTEDTECINKILPDLKTLDRIIMSYRGEKSDNLIFYKNPDLINALVQLPRSLPRLARCQRAQAKLKVKKEKEELEKLKKEAEKPKGK